jgi:hypothetical protein
MSSSSSDDDRRDLLRGLPAAKGKVRVSADREIRKGKSSFVVHAAPTAETKELDEAGELEHFIVKRKSSSSATAMKRSKRTESASPGGASGAAAAKDELSVHDDIDSGDLARDEGKEDLRDLWDGRDSKSSNEDEKGVAQRSSVSQMNNLEDLSTKQMMYYEIKNPSLRQQNQSMQTAPVNVVMPGGEVMLGISSKKKPKMRDDISSLELVLFSSPGHDSLNKFKLYKCFLFVLYPVDIGVVTAIFGDAATSGHLNTVDAIVYISTIMALIFALLAIYVRSSRALVLFVVVYYIDGIINLYRVENVFNLQCAHFACQLAIAHSISSIKNSIIGSWSAPS